MATLRTANHRQLRLQLSTRYQYLHRRPRSTGRLAPNPVPKPTVAEYPTKPPTFLRRNRSHVLWATLSLFLGAIGGQVVVHTVAPPALPERGTREDAILLADLNKRIDEHFKVKVLKGKCLAIPKQLKGEEGGWYELIPNPAEPTQKEEDIQHALVSQMRGAKGLAVERNFWDKGEQKLVSVMFFGGSLCGWPGLTHGGAIATVLAEKLSLAAALAEHCSNSDTMAAATPQRMPGTGDHAKMFAPADVPDEPAQLSLTYVKPTFANQFYVVRVQRGVAEDTGATTPSEPLGGAEYEATLETQDGKVMVKAKARFAPSTAIQRGERRAVSVAKQTYEEFKEWMWPSRQKNWQLG